MIDFGFFIQFFLFLFLSNIKIYGWNDNNLLLIETNNKSWSLSPQTKNKDKNNDNLVWHGLCGFLLALCFFSESIIPWNRILDCGMRCVSVFCLCPSIFIYSLVSAYLIKICNLLIGQLRFCQLCFLGWVFDFLFKFGFCFDCWKKTKGILGCRLLAVIVMQIWGALSELQVVLKKKYKCFFFYFSSVMS